MPNAPIRAVMDDRADEMNSVQLTKTTTRSATGSQEACRRWMSEDAKFALGY
jgi:hypothetical protein